MQDAERKGDEDDIKLQKRCTRHFLSCKYLELARDLLMTDSMWSDFLGPCQVKNNQKLYTTPSWNNMDSLLFKIDVCAASGWMLEGKFLFLCPRKSFSSKILF